MPKMTLLVMAIVGLNVIGAGLACAEALEITVPEVRVYAKPDVKSEAITTLFNGDSVPVSTKGVPGFKKVLITDGASKKIGYVRLTDLVPLKAHVNNPKAAKAAAKTRAVTKAAKSLHGRYALGFAPGLSYQYQNSRSYTDSNGGNATIGALSGSNVEFSGSLDVPLTYNIKLHTYLTFAQVNVTGTATYQTTTIAAVPEPTLLNETFICLGAMAEIYMSNKSNWWWGGLLQVNHGTSGSLTYGSFAAIKLQSSELPNLILGQAATGYDFSLGGHFFLTPDLRIGGVLNALPIILEADANLTFAYGF
jgi:hypothetical protein